MPAAVVAPVIPLAATWVGFTLRVAPLQLRISDPYSTSGASSTHENP